MPAFVRAFFWTRRGQLAEPMHGIERRIYSIRGHKVMLDRELAELYGVKTIALRQQVKRNRIRFPKDFLFQLSKKEADLLVSQNVIPSRRSLDGSLPMRSPNKVSPCFLQCSPAAGLCKSISPSCAPS